MKEKEEAEKMAARKWEKKVRRSRQKSYSYIRGYLHNIGRARSSFNFEAPYFLLELGSNLLNISIV